MWVLETDTPILCPHLGPKWSWANDLTSSCFCILVYIIIVHWFVFLSTLSKKPIYLFIFLNWAESLKGQIKPFSSMKIPEILGRHIILRVYLLTDL